MCFGGFLVLSRFQYVSVVCAQCFLYWNDLLDLHTNQTFSCGSPFGVFCLPQLILQSAEKNRLSIIPPHNPLLSVCVCNWRAFLHCL